MRAEENVRVGVEKGAAVEQRHEDRDACDSSRPWGGYDHEAIADASMGRPDPYAPAGSSAGGGEAAHCLRSHGSGPASKAVSAAVPPYLRKVDDPDFRPSRQPEIEAPRLEGPSVCGPTLWWHDAGPDNASADYRIGARTGLTLADGHG